METAAKRGTLFREKAEKWEPRLYEAMFLVDSAEGSQNQDEITGTIKTILERAEAEIVSIKKWDVRKLAYKINGKTRGTYILCYFKADGERIQNIEKDVQLSEQIMRVLILSAETRAAENVEEALRKMGTQEDIGVTEAEKEKQKEPKRDKEDLETQNAAEESAEKASTQEETEQAGEPEQSGAPAAADVIEPEQPDEPTAADVIEPEQLGQSETEKDF
ncbi:MAG TPA: 30S ribosomal protein S6 [Sedimentisphaerales bacterium]|nr:30S ribosomal protein S6 [Sedimentisphaerales bacterium]